MIRSFNRRNSLSAFAALSGFPLLRFGTILRPENRDKDIAIHPTIKV